MSDGGTEAQWSNREDLERLKIFIEIAKYAITIVIALAAVGGALAKLGSSTWSSAHYWLGGGVILNVLVFLTSHRLVSAALNLATIKLPDGELVNRIDDLKNKTYSFFVVVFIGTILYWSFALFLISTH